MKDLRPLVLWSWVSQACAELGKFFVYHSYFHTHRNYLRANQTDVVFWHLAWMAWTALMTVLGCKWSRWHATLHTSWWGRLSYTSGGRASLFLTYCYCSVSSEDLVVWLLVVTYMIKHVPLYMYFTLFTNTFINRSFWLRYSHSVCTHASLSLVSQHHSHS